MSLLNSKKGQAHNYLALVIFLFTFSFLSIFGTMLFLKFIDAFTTAGIYAGQIAETGAALYRAFLIYDYIIVFVLIALLIALGITNWRLRTSPAFFIVTIIEATVIGFVSYFFNYIFIQMVSDPAFTTALLVFPRTMLICTNLHWVALVAIVIGSITLYGKKSQEGGTYIE